MNDSCWLSVEQMRVGDHVRLVGCPPIWLKVEDVRDPSSLTLRAPGGQLLRAGRYAVSEIHRPLANEIQSRRTAHD